MTEEEKVIKQMQEKYEEQKKELQDEIKTLTSDMRKGLIDEGTFNKAKKEWETKLEKLDPDKYETYQKQIEELTAKVETMGEKLNKGGEGSVDAFKSVTKEVMEENKEAIEAVRLGQSKAVSMQLKGVVNITDDVDGDINITSRVNRIVDHPEVVRLNVRDLLTIQSTDLPQLAFMVVYEWDDNTGMLSENSALSESSFKEKEEQYSVKRLGTFINVSKNLMRSMKTLWAHVIAKLPARVKYYEDGQLLNGDGTGDNVEGIFKKSLDFVEGVTPVVRPAASVSGVATANAGASAAITLAAALPADTAEVGDYVYITGAAESSYNSTLIPIEVVTSLTELQIGVAYVAEADTSAWTFTLVKAKFSGFYKATEAAQGIDVLLDAGTMVNVQEYRNTGICLHPITANNLSKLKGNDDHYLSNGAIVKIEKVNGIMYIGGIPVVETTAMPIGKFILGDWMLAAALWLYEDMTLVISEDNQSIRENYVQVAIFEQIIFPIYNKYMFVSGTIDDCVAVISQ